jgi:hypothetical protein
MDVIPSSWNPERSGPEGASTLNPDEPIFFEKSPITVPKVKESFFKTAHWS